jgi:hypothetical protein
MEGVKVSDWKDGATTTVTIRKGVYEATFTVHSAQIYADDLEQIQMFVHHMHGVHSYDQRDVKRYPVEEPK